MLSCLSSLDSISGIMLKHNGEDIPPYLTPFLIRNEFVSLLLSKRLLVSLFHISANIATVSLSHPMLVMVSYSI